MKIVVSGSRYTTSSPIIESFVNSLPNDSVIYHGGCRGVDLLVAHIAAKRGLQVIEMRAEWDKYGNAAGPIRNRQMLDLKPDLVVLFHEDLTKSKGTLNMLNEVKKRDIPYKYYQI